MTVSFDTSLLVNYYNAKAGIPAQTDSSGSSTGTGTTGSTKTNSPTGQADAPRAPWAGSSGMLSESDLVTKVLGGQRFINSSAVTSNVVNASPDYNKLFTLYQGLSALEGLATKAQDSKTSALALAAIQRRFTAGMEEVRGYISDTSYDHMALSPGTLTNELKSTVGTARTDTLYTAPAIHSGSATSPVKAFEGDVKFSMSVKKVGTTAPFTVNIDLSDMGTQTRSMSNVVSYINGKLKEQGLQTQFKVNRTPAVPTTTTVNGKTVTLSAGQDSFGLQIKGVTTEAVTMSAPATADSVYVVQTTGDPTITTTKKNADGTSTKTNGVSSQLIKFQTDQSSTTDQPDDPISKVGAKYWVDGEAGQTALPNSVANINDNGTSPDTLANALQTAAGPDGSVYVLANVNNTTDDQTIKGRQDVALIKYDSAGKIVFTRTLGASDSASGLALAVSADGKVAVTGSVTGALDIGVTKTTTYGTGTNTATSTSTTTTSLTGANNTTSDSFVTVYDASGVEQWTQRRGSSGADEATSVTFGDDGSVYVGGRTQGLMQGASGQANGGWDGYVMGFTASGTHKFTIQTGTAQTDTVSQVATDGNTLYVAGVEGGQATLKSYTMGSQVVDKTTTNAQGVTTTTQVTQYSANQTAARNLGGIGGGSISGISVYNGQVYLGGSSGSADLLGGGSNAATSYSGGYDAFALHVDKDLTVTSGDRVAFYGGAGTEKDAKVQFSDGKAWISGQTTGDIAGTTKMNSKDAYLARLNIDSGQVEYQTRYAGTNGTVAPNAIAISKNSSSVLDRLGLPLGKVETTDSKLIIAGTSVRTGDQFYLVDSKTGVKKAVTIDANETMASLAKKINRASGYKLTANVTKVLGKQLDQLDIKPSNKSSEMQIVAGPAGKDALAGLGLDPGLVSNKAGQTMDASSSNYLTSQKAIGLDFDTSINLNSAAGITKALAALKTTMKNVQKAYTYLRYGDPQDSTSTKAGKTGGTVPQYMTDQIANYQAALNRLTGGG
ncbi:transcriptional regulator [Asticcacaulis sp. AC466]|uniref:transcriptional regulator n=1 Tax=Asticcacaulis sp. AC466 TaxID=1282362 RepID=UPI001F49129B|nr:transcriptional regulator [Asticcacaulis sp. AC466]